ncbi:hypothetical protein ABZP36_034487 [Zizania latifolia]
MNFKGNMPVPLTWLASDINLKFHSKKRRGRILWLHKFLENKQRAQRALTLIVLIGTCMLIGDGALTPAISVLSVLSKEYSQDLHALHRVNDVLSSMHKDAGEAGEMKSTEGEFLLRVDGGATVNNLLMQIQKAMRKAHIYPRSGRKYLVGHIVAAIDFSFGAVPSIICKKGSVHELRLCFHKDYQMPNLVVEVIGDQSDDGRETEVVDTLYLYRSLARRGMTHRHL